MGYHARYEKYFFYGMLILICLLIIGGLLAALTHREEGLIGRMRREEEQKNADEGEKAPEEEKAPEIVINNPNIRVLIMTNGYANIVHPSVEMSSASGFCITFGDQTQEAGPEQPLTFAPDDPRFQSGQIRVSAKDGGEIALNSIQRGCGTPSYAGVIELRTTAEGIAVINELPVETYLCRVVPSEMPYTYELEALKAQAVCARSYAYQQMQSFAYPEYEAHVNDSTDYQVYGNSLPQEATNQAVAETGGQVVRYQDRLVTTYYYSTSCGKTAGVEAWGTAPNAENQYLQSVEVKDEQGDYEAGLPWYRWEAKIPAGTLSALISQNTGTNVGTLQSVEVTKSGAGGVALQICATGDAGSVTVDTENKIRRALGGSGYEIVNQAGTAAASTALLPSAFFTIRREGDVFIISGGGFGHGIGMSQNGANEMAKKGKNYIDILTMFFREVSVGG
ncbi:SpoIID/LytB domain-containing protein [Lachnospiraceae bacterium 56-18]|uniref:SpoIID/LytB domain-containing protein n=1 Tax=Sporofaciens sp. JLR.KK001 TaxID=3112621 RepID=UPI002FF04D64